MAGIYVQDFRKASETWEQAEARILIALRRAAESVGCSFAGEPRITRRDDALHFIDARVDVTHDNPR